MRILIILVFFSSLTTNESITDDRLKNEKNDDTIDPNEKPLILRSVDKNPNLPKETQMAQCTVQSGDTKASAQATFSKKLEGFCSNDDMKMLHETLIDMELRIYRDIYNLQKMIQNFLSSSNLHQYSIPRRDYFPQKNPYDRHSDNQNQRVSNNDDHVKILSKTSTATTTVRPEVKTSSPILNANHLKSLDKKEKSEKHQNDKSAFTSTTQNMKPKNEYTYYWKIDRFPNAFQNARKHEIFSHIFNVKGLFLRIRAHLNYLESENLYLNIEHLANIENSEKMEIEISDGVVFKEITEEKLFQYSFVILDQVNPNHDLISQVYWNNENESFLIPNSIHLLSNYVKDYSILIKLIISF